jgi:hypothetical protein
LIRADDGLVVFIGEYSLHRTCNPFKSDF